MLRLIHAQTTQGAILVDDIDDGLPNKNVRRLSGDPKAYNRDGYANAPKQKCYIPRVKASNPSLPGYIDLEETPRVTHSAFSGKIAGLQQKGLITVVSLVASDLATPTVATAVLDDPGAGDLTISGTGFLSVSPEISSVVLTGTGAVTLTQTQITTGGGTFTNTSIVIPAALVASIAATTTSAQVLADAKASNVVVLTT